ncbi:uncharacterized protein CMU_007840 [Cryptosporidium muris RN66]|uniref:AMP-activated protein kinase glycogen-binding domain-containing protein n=1 Tax=Cryptosporidium muris (strain RN66) TaxID=441375 RepID=B6ADK2_CRYMR|nr:uncharacterized protein CMU_007840 [Cryptosporidium muris RN66]EEA06293.1 hypothetical protein, conserved [Cryptosporidium muris RN66]|eukprot:XP_002140642.1 hypothetical protein [Cryptosporidium muris RN66]
MGTTSSSPSSSSLNQSSSSSLIIAEKVQTQPESDNDKIQCLLKWTHGGNEVFVVGSFNKWNIDEKIKLCRNGHDHIIVVELSKDIHCYKYIVDGEWRYSFDDCIETDDNGNVNNIIDLRNYRAPQYFIPNEYYQIKYAHYHQNMPLEYPADAPALPLLLKKSKCPLEVCNNLHTPFHCISNHIYYDSMIQDIFGPYMVTFCVTRRWQGADNIPHETKCYQRYTTLLYATIRNSEADFDYISTSRSYNRYDDYKEHIQQIDGEDKYYSVRMRVLTELFASIFL